MEEKRVGWICVGVCVLERKEEAGRGCQQASPPVNSGGQTISLIEFNPGSPQEAGWLH